MWLAMKQGRNKGATKKGERTTKQGSKEGSNKIRKQWNKGMQKKRKTKKHNGVKQKIGPVHIQEPKKEHEAFSSHYRWAMTPPKA